jgi:hypothetical protein
MGTGTMLPFAAREQHHAENNDCASQYTLSTDKVVIILHHNDLAKDKTLFNNVTWTNL